MTETKAVKFADALSQVAKRLLDETAVIHVPIEIQGFTAGGVLMIKPSGAAVEEKEDTKVAAALLCVQYLRQFRKHNSKATQNDVWRWLLGGGRDFLNGIAAMILDKWNTPLYMGDDKDDIVATICVGSYAPTKEALDKVLLVSADGGRSLLKTKPDKHMVILIETQKHHVFVVDLIAVSLGVVAREVAGLACPAAFRTMDAAREYLHLPKSAVKAMGASAWFVHQMKAHDEGDARVRLAVALGMNTLQHFEKEVGFGLEGNV